MFADQLAELDVPASARLVGIQTRDSADGSVEWVATFRGPAPASGRRRQANLTQAGGMPPPPPRLSDLQIGSSRPEEVQVDRAPSPELPAAAPEAGDRPLMSPVPGPFPLLPSQPGSTNRLFPLRCSVQKYAWGKFGADSLVGKLAANNDTDITVDAKTPYAELWMGTHPSGPSMVMLVRRPPSRLSPPFSSQTHPTSPSPPLNALDGNPPTPPDPPWPCWCGVRPPASPSLLLPNPSH
jgi:hypothetical protein